MYFDTNELQQTRWVSERSMTVWRKLLTAGIIVINNEAKVQTVLMTLICGLRVQKLTF